MIDFYLRAPGDPNYVDTVTSSMNGFENTIAQVRMTLLTKKGEVLGEPDFGFDPTRYLFEFEGSDLQPIEREANDQIQNYVMLSKIYAIKAEVFQFDDESNPYRMGLGLSVSIDGVKPFAAFYE
jgi:hypothetical protein